jgi:LytS/YehU family sensor histidine kinase
MYYRKPSPDYADNTLEYAMLTGKVKDTTWSPTGHLLILPQLESGKHYRLLVRYRQNPALIKVNTFYTDPAWYQTAQFYWILIASLFILVLTVFLLKNRLGLKKEKNKGIVLKNNLQSIRAQLNPHFIFNALSSIQSLMNDKKIDSANHYLSAFSDLLRQALLNSNREMIPLEQELQLLATYLSLEQLRFPFSYTLHVDESIDRSSLEIPSLLLQPVVENAIRHAAGPLAEKGKLEINFRVHKDDLLVSVIDNGPGFDPQSLKGEGHGIRLTTERISSLNQLIHPRHIHFKLNSTKTGTAVHLNFRNWL